MTNYLGYHKALTAMLKDIYKNWINELSEHFKLNSGEKNNIDFSRARHSISFNMTQEYVSPRIDRILSTDKLLGIKRGYRRGVALKLKEAASTSSIAASLPWDPPILDSDLREFFN
ncbi:hypothetical protein PanWU01x14_019710 [Parasponia andersonii]|uniref:Uncharacterized protein n=1 Tax=Parasponia andersonii TaxID=3476 RepID=A0A2P5DYI5_PARAD|nr:hypothetical protein PanWU01x14_019710 [Parasponia andersonii]